MYATSLTTRDQYAKADLVDQIGERHTEKWKEEDNF